MNPVKIPMIMILAAVLGIVPGVAASPPPQNLLLSCGPDDHPMTGISRRILTEAYARLGISVTFKEFPPKRYQSAADNHEVDGISFGGEEINLDYPHLVKVGAVLGYDEIVVFSKTFHFVPSSWKSLIPYSIGIQMGMPGVETATKGMKVQAVTSAAQLFNKMEIGRTDLVVLPRAIGLKALAELKLTDIYILEPPLERLGLYHYLHESKKALVPQIEKVLLDMERSGRIAQITKEALSALR